MIFLCISQKSKSGNLSCNMFMCIILIFFPFSIPLLTICIIPSLEYVLSIRPLRFSSRQWNDILLFVGIKFLLWIYRAISPDLLMFYRCFSSLFYWQELFCVFSFNKSYDCRFDEFFWFSYSMASFSISSNIFTWCIYINLI